MKTKFKEWYAEKLLKEMSDAEAEQILGVKRGDPNLKQAHRKLVLQHHPDRGGTHEMITKINGARDVLMAPPKPAVNFGQQPPQQYDPQTANRRRQEARQRRRQPPPPPQQEPWQQRRQESYGDQERIKDFASRYFDSKTISLAFVNALEKIGKIKATARRLFPQFGWANEDRAKSAIQQHYDKNSASAAFLKDMTMMLYAEMASAGMSFTSILDFLKTQSPAHKANKKTRPHEPE